MSTRRRPNQIASTGVLSKHGSDVAPGPKFVYKPSVNSRVYQAPEHEEVLLLATLFDIEPERCLRRMPGRLTFLARLASIADGARMVVKRFEGGPGREGLLERLSGRRVRSEGRREFEILSDLEAVGIPVPRPIRFVENRAASSLLPFRSRARAKSAVLMECVEHFDDARTALAGQAPTDRKELAAGILQVVRRLHERGWFHRDLYLQHFLLPCESARGPVLIDVARARWSSNPRRRWLVKDLAALQLSAPGNVTRTERLRFLRGWLEGQGTREALAWKRWARQVTAKARRLGAHRPRFEDEAQQVGVEPERTLPGRGSSQFSAAEVTVDHE